MASNVYTKNEILQSLAERGYFIDSYTLDTFLKKWRVEAIFEDEQGSEFFDKNALDLVMENLFSNSAQNNQQEAEEEVRTLSPKPQNMQPQPMQQMAPQRMQQVERQMQQQYQPQMQQMPQYQQPMQNNYPNQNIPQQNMQLDDYETAEILNNTILSNGTNLASNININTANVPPSPMQQAFVPRQEIPTPPPPPKKEQPKKMGILEGAFQAAGQEYNEEPPEEEKNQNDMEQDIPQDVTQGDIIPPSDETGDFDDISLLSESLEAQEKLREYVVSELSKKNLDVTPKSNEFKLDISERTISMIARTMAKKIAKHVSAICMQDAKSAAQLAEIQEENQKLEKRAKELEDQNKKLRLLLAESNKNLNSYKPSIFGLYKKVIPPSQ